MQLLVNGIALPISQMGPDFVLGAIVGAIMGARVGKQRIPPEWIAGITEWHRSVSLLTQVAAKLNTIGWIQRPSHPSEQKSSNAFWRAPGFIPRNSSSRDSKSRRVRTFAPPLSSSSAQYDSGGVALTCLRGCG
jgi:hypothetical protein